MKRHISDTAMKGRVSGIVMKRHVSDIYEETRFRYSHEETFQIQP
jgi:hypothetical protein